MTLGIFFTEIVSYMSIMDPKLVWISQNMKKNACLSQNIWCVVRTMYHVQHKSTLFLKVWSLVAYI